MGLIEPDGEEKIIGIPMVISNLTLLYYEILPSMERKKQPFPFVSSCPDLYPNHSPIVFPWLEALIGFRSFSKRL
jgi:hypothetical protein